MKRILIGTALFLLAHAVMAQPSNPPRYIQGTTVAALPAAASQANNVWTIHDGTSATDCTVGGGTTQVLCYSNGSIWAVAGSSGTVSSGSGYKLPAYASASGTTLGPSNVTTDATGNNLNVPGTLCTGGSCPTTGVHIGALGTATNWNFDTTTPATALTSIGASKADLSNLTAPTAINDSALTFAGNGGIAVTGTSVIRNTIPGTNFYINNGSLDAFALASDGSNTSLTVRGNTLGNFLVMSPPGNSSGVSSISSSAALNLSTGSSFAGFSINDIGGGSTEILGNLNYNSGANLELILAGNSSNSGVGGDVAFRGGNSTVGTGHVRIQNSAGTSDRLTVAGDTGLLKMDAVEAMGVQTVSGCSLTANVGGSWAGKFASGTTGTCTVTITPGITATNGFFCSANDLTTTSDKVVQTGSTTTACTISGTTVSGDVINWIMVAY